MSPINSEDITKKFRWNRDRFEKIDDKIDKMKMIIEAKPAANQKFLMSPQANLAEAMARLQPVSPVPSPYLMEAP